MPCADLHNKKVPWPDPENDANGVIAGKDMDGDNAWIGRNAYNLLKKRGFRFKGDEWRDNDGDGIIRTQVWTGPGKAKVFVTQEGGAQDNDSHNLFRCECR